jgi:hypothetical protein
MTETKKPAPPKPLGERVALALGGIVRGMANEWSEDLTSDVWKPFHCSLDPNTGLTADTFRSCAKVQRRWPIDEHAYTEYFDYVLNPGAGFDPEKVESYRILRNVMDTLLTERTIFKAGEGKVIKVRDYIVGRLKDGSVVGVWAIETQT